MKIVTSLAEAKCRDIRRLLLSMAGDSAGFESYFGGSWWDVQIQRERSSMFELKYTANEDDEGAWVSLTELRLSSRRADVWDCYTINKGMDVAVLAKHPHTKALNLEKEGLYDARVASVKRSIHAPGKCWCKFAIRFFDAKLDTSADGTGWNLFNRIPLTDEPAIEVSISDIRILQKPAIVPLRHVLDAHLDRKWIPFGRGCQDAYFLAETELSITTLARGAVVRNVRSAEVLSPSSARVLEKNEERASKCNTPGDVDGPLPEDLPGSREALGRPEGDSRASDSPENHEQKEGAGNATVASPRNITIERECFSAQEHEEDRSNGIVREGSQVQKGIHPKREYIQNRQKKNTRNTVDDSIDVEVTGNANVASPRNITIERECFSAQEHEEDRPNGIVREGSLLKKGIHPKREHIQNRQKKNTRNTVDDSIDVECTQLSSGIHPKRELIQNRQKKNTRNTVDDSIDVECTQLSSGVHPKREYIQNRQKKNTRNTVDDWIDVECTQLSSDTSDSETEWEPKKKKLPISPSNIRTRDKTIAHKKPKLELGRELARRPSLRSATRSGTKSSNSARGLSRAGKGYQP